MFSDSLRVSIDLDDKTVRLSIKQSDSCVVTYEFPLSMFKHLMEEFHRQLKENNLY